MLGKFEAMVEVPDHPCGVQLAPRLAVMVPSGVPTTSQNDEVGQDRPVTSSMATVLGSLLHDCPFQVIVESATARQNVGEAQLMASKIGKPSVPGSVVGLDQVPEL